MAKNHPVAVKMAALRPIIDAALAQIAKDNGLESLKIGKGKYMDGSFTFNLDGVMAGGVSKEGALYEQLAVMEDGLPALGWSFDHKGTSFTIIGCNTTGSKVICSAFTGKQYLFTVDYVKRLWAATPKLSAGHGGSVSVAHLIPAVAK